MNNRDVLSFSVVAIFPRYRTGKNRHYNPLKKSYVSWRVEFWKN